jgi:tripartite ATP-independent transporter DctP family solute receptor
MKTLRSLVWLVGLVMTLPFALPASAQLDEEIKIRLGHVMPPNHFEHELFLKLAETIAERSNNKIQIEVFPASQLGSEREQTEQLNIGALEMHSSGGAIQLYQPQLGAWALPFIFRGPEHFDKVVDGPIGEDMVRLGLEKSDIRILALYPNGERMFFSNEGPYDELADFKGVKIRVDDQPVSAQIWRTLGANPVPIAFAELYTSLQTGVIDAGENPPFNIIRLKFYEVGKYVTETRHSLTTMALMTNEDWWQGLPEEARQIITQAVQEWVPERRQASWDADAAALDELRSLGAVVTPLKNRKEFEEALFPLYQEFGERTGATELIESIRATN